MNLVEGKSTKFKFWTKLGLAKLGEIIRESRELKKITLRQAGEIVSEVSGMSINYRTINSIENAQGIPQFNTLVAIAASRIVTCDRGIPLSIYDFIDVASERFKGSSMDVLVRLIKLELETQGWTLRQMAQECGIEFVDLFDISEGRESEDFETDLILLGSVLTNPKTGETFGNAEDIIQFCGITINPADDEQDCFVGH
jgi:transcriptional regulator with XRE-family HTH domain